MDDREMAQALLRREEGAMEALLHHYSPLMRYIIAPILPDEREREECLSDVCLRVWERVGQFDPQRGGWKSWLSALTRNTALNRARKNQGAGWEQELDSSLPDDKAGPEEQLLRRERLEALSRAIAALSPQERALFYRKYYYMQSTAQMASELGLTERAVEGRLYRLKKRLRLELGGDDHA